MRILIVGGGGREHALAWKLRSQRPELTIFIAPGNGGTEADGFINVPVQAGDIAGLVDLASRERVDLVIPGPELPLTLGVTDAMNAAGIACFGPDKFCARLEGSKSFAKEIMEKSGVPTGKSKTFTDHAEARAYAQSLGAPLVVKADGLAAGKGVVVAQSLDEALAALDEIMLEKIHGNAGSKVLVEEFLSGEEASFICFCDGETALPLPSSQDHKAVFDNDQGPNTGGMGAYSPAPVLPDNTATATAALTVDPVLKTMAAMGHPFRGMLYAGLMMTKDGPKVLEYNTRFGDPECQPLLMRLDSDLLGIIKACLDGRLKEVNLAVSPKSAMGVVIAGRGYPGTSAKGMVISGLDEAEKMPGVKVFHSSTRMENGALIAGGGRIMCVTALGDGLEAARSNAYAALEKVKMDEGHWRTDIGMKGIKRMG